MKIKDEWRPICGGCGKGMLLTEYYSSCDWDYLGHESWACDTKGCPVPPDHELEPDAEVDVN